MSLGRVILCILLPPLAVLDKGCGAILLVTILTLAGWIPGALAALFICAQQKPQATQITVIQQVPPPAERPRE